MTCFRDFWKMSALPPKADMCGALGHVRFTPRERTRSGAQADVGFGPKADSCSAAKTNVIRSPRPAPVGGPQVDYLGAD